MTLKPDTDSHCQHFLQTIENTREKDEALVNPDDEEVLADEADDEFAGGVMID